MSAFYKIAFGVLSVLMPVAFKIRTEGQENLPQEGGCLYVSNHRSNADPILIGLQNRKAQFCFLAKQELFSKGLIGRILRRLGAVAIDRGTGDLSPLAELSERLKNGENALIFPEGTRSKDGSLGRFKTGAALIAAQTGAPVVPVGISFSGKLRFRSRITVRFGAPFSIPQTDPENPSPAVLKQVRQEMTKRVSALLPAPPEALPMQEDAPAQKGDLKS
ncbi:MAG: 1-acyl-sn-glycerol-3-phosphate acyltransferase [Oscillospiraceae bacterium]|nr:1-acyl-sn-glycerol-3-phosphate acyltransferase [Oscillospiraceae bacterium]MCR5305723.1 1-acyl-sn-glycerol-3-phosphate acyltransferase [Oscillospiraceae bacterium]